MDRFPFAVALFKDYVKPNKYPFEKPLFNFQHILFDVIETENVSFKNKPSNINFKKGFQKKKKRITITAATILRAHC